MNAQLAEATRRYTNSVATMPPARCNTYYGLAFQTGNVYAVRYYSNPVALRAALASLKKCGRRVRVKIGDTIGWVDA